MEVQKARDVSPVDAMITMVLGPQGMGKSTFCSTVAEVVDPKEVLLIAALSREAKTAGYQHYNFDTVFIEESLDWDPAAKKYNPTAFREVMDIIKGLAADEKYAAVIIDNGTEVAEYAWHGALAPLKIGDPGELGIGGNRFTPYTTIRESMERFMTHVGRLTGDHCARKKHILIPWHPQKPSEDELENKGVEYCGTEVPMVRGSFRRRAGAKIDAVVYMRRDPKVDKSTLKSTMEWKLQVASDVDRHCKIPGLLDPKVNLIEPRFSKLLKLVERSVEKDA